jgi:hypothetical protein
MFNRREFLVSIPALALSLSATCASPNPTARSVALKTALRYAGDNGCAPTFTSGIAQTLQVVKFGFNVRYLGAL